MRAAREKFSKSIKRKLNNFHKKNINKHVWNINLL